MVTGTINEQCHDISKNAIDGKKKKQLGKHNWADGGRSTITNHRTQSATKNIFVAHRTHSFSAASSLYPK